MSRPNPVRLTLLMATLFVALAALATSPSFAPTPRVRHAQHVAQVPPLVVAPEGRLAEVFETSRPASVRIESRGNLLNPRPDGIGTGFFISADGLVLTAYHVVERGRNLAAVTPDDERYPLTLIGFDAYQDLALMQAEVTRPVPYLELADLAPRVGSEVVAIGNSSGDFLQGRAGQVTALEVEAVNPTFASGTIELTASLSPGDSGGPVLNDAGEVVGVVSYISFQPGVVPYVEGGDVELPRFFQRAAPRTFASYAVPVLANSMLVTDLRAGLARDIPVIGFSGGDYNPRTWRDADLGPRAGVLVEFVQPGSPGAVAGLRGLPQGSVSALRNSRAPQGADVIIAIDGARTRNFNELVTLLRAKEVGERVVVTVQRGSEITDLEIKLVSRASLN